MGMLKTKSNLVHDMTDADRPFFGFSFCYSAQLSSQFITNKGYADQTSTRLIPETSDIMNVRGTIASQLSVLGAQPAQQPPVKMHTVRVQCLQTRFYFV